MISTPHNIEAEYSVIGALLIDNKAYDNVADLITAEDFFVEKNAQAYLVISSMIEKGEPADVVTVAEKTDDLDYLLTIHSNTPSAANARHYAGIVRDKAIERKLLAASQEIRDVVEGKGSVTEKLAASEVALGRVLESRKTGGVKVLREALLRAVENLDMRFQSGGKMSGVSTGFDDLDELTSGLQAGDLIIVAGRPSMGKSSFADQIAEAVAAAGKPTMTFSLEMTDDQTATRRLASASRISLQTLRSGNVQPDQWDRIAVGVQKLNDLPMYIDDTPGISAPEIRAKAARMKREKGLGLIVVDYLQLMRGDGNNRNDEIGGISRALKSIAKELSVPVIAVSQLSRRCEERADKRPIMSDLRESGQIEQDADVIMFVYRDDVYDPQSPMKGTAEIIIGKQRMGPRDKVMLTFLGEYTRFENYTGGPVTNMQTYARKRGFAG